MASDNKIYIRQYQAAKEFGVSETVLSEARRNGEISGLNISLSDGPAVIYDRSVVAEFVAKRKEVLKNKEEARRFAAKASNANHNIKRSNNNLWKKTYDRAAISEYPVGICAECVWLNKSICKENSFAVKIEDPTSDFCGRGFFLRSDGHSGPFTFWSTQKGFAIIQERRKK